MFAFLASLFAPRQSYATEAHIRRVMRRRDAGFKGVRGNFSVGGR